MNNLKYKWGKSNKGKKFQDEKKKESHQQNSLLLSFLTVTTIMPSKLLLENYCAVRITSSNAKELIYLIFHFLNLS